MSFGDNHVHLAGVVSFWLGRVEEGPAMAKYSIVHKQVQE